MTPAARAHNRAFTLLEILAVVAIFALIAGLALPNFSVLHTRNMKHQARRIVSQIELARQRAIVTGIPHRLYIDVDAGAYRIEWLVVEDALGGAASESDDAFGGFEPAIDLSAPRAAERSYHPLAGTMGRLALLDEGSGFTGVETTNGWISGGETFIHFERDGSADATTIVLEHESGLSVTLEVLPLADTVRVRHETA
jgi:prepilin-type N-terminal cleavage/methylation domain-containing protein